MGIKIIEINSYVDFLSLKEKWVDVLCHSEHSIFSTWEWLSICWKHFGAGKKLLVLLAEENGTIIGIAPLMYSVETMFGLRKKKIEFIGTTYSDYNDFILSERTDECLKLFIDYINNISEKWDSIILTDIPENSKGLPFLRKVAKTVKPLHKCHYLTLPQSYDVFFRALSSNLRKDLRRAERNPKIEFIDYSMSYSLVEGMNIFFDLHQRRWKSKGSLGIFADQRARNFNLDIAQSFSQKGWLGLFLLKHSGTPVAALYGFRYGSKYYDYLTGFDPRYSKCGVGNVILSNVISKCIQEGLAEFDFVRGAEDYKNRWNTQTRWNSQSVLIRAGPFAKVENWLYNEYWQQGNRLKYVLKLK